MGGDGTSRLGGTVQSIVIILFGIIFWSVIVLTECWITVETRRRRRQGWPGLERWGYRFGFKMGLRQRLYRRWMRHPLVCLAGIIGDLAVRR